MIVTLENNQEEIAIPEELEATLKKAMDIVARKENLTDNTEVDITIVNNEEIHTLNREYRGIDRPTDVLALPWTREMRNRKWTTGQQNTCWVM